MSKGMSIKDAIKAFEEKTAAETGNPCVAAECEKVVLCGVCPPIEKMDATLSTLKACQHLALSTNCIEKLSSLSGMESLKILSVGRNNLKKIENLDAVADTLEELWISYNSISSLSGVEKLGNLRVLYISNNKIASWAEVEKLTGLASLEDLLLVGNPLYNDAKDAGTLAEYRIEVIRRVPQLKKLDGIPVDVDERDAAAAS
mmetsp:Transcript_50328/g.109612  ORF Transcript_50328/g.109612 Transcript_50328/m.109612 type:complete len:202 (-) Transcript_50328:119-724(-)